MTDKDEQDPGARVREWIAAVRMAQLGRVTKLVAYALAHYADGDGRRIFPGVARIAVECELSYNSVKAALQKLRDVGLIERVRRATNAYGRAEEYRLIIHKDLMERADGWLDPNATRAAIDKMQASRRGTYSPVLRPTEEAADDTDSDDLRPTTRAADVSAQPVDNPPLRPTGRAAGGGHPIESAAHGTTAGFESAAHGTGLLRPTPRPPTNQRPITTTTNHTAADVRSNLALSRAQEPDEDPTRELTVVDKGEAATYGRHAAPIDPADNVIRVDFGAA